MNICSECGGAIETGSFIGTGGGVAHASCYHAANPPLNRKTFKSVLVNCDDQVLVRDLLVKLVPEEIKDEIIESFNKVMQDRHKKRLAYHLTN